MKKYTEYIKKAKRLSHKEIGFINDFIRTKNGTQAILNNYDTKKPGVASAMANELLKRPKITNIIKAIADEIKDEDLVKVHKEGLEAINKDGIDYSTRHKYLDTAYKLKGSYAAEKSQILNVNIDLENIEYIESVTEKAINQLKNDELES